MDTRRRQWDEVAGLSADDLKRQRADTHAEDLRVKIEKLDRLVGAVNDPTPTRPEGTES